MELTSNNQAADKYEIKLIAAPLNCKLVYSTLCVALEKFAEKFKIIFVVFPLQSHMVCLQPDTSKISTPHKI